MIFTKVKKRWAFIAALLFIIACLAFYPLPPQAPIQYIDRQSKELKTEKVPGENWLVWLYYNPMGEATLWALAKRKLLSSVYGYMMDRPASVKKIEPFIDEFDIDMSIAEKHEFSSFNDFFTRKLDTDARPVDTTPTVVVSPADGKLLAWANIAHGDFIIKGYRFDVATFLADPTLAQNYNDGALIVVRLAPPDYHRFHFPVGGSVSPVKRIDGFYYSVNPIALRDMADIFILNKREYSIITNPVFGDVIMAEVGATMVGSIVQTFHGDFATKGEEKGYFKFGGSSIVLMFEKNKIHIDEDLLENTKQGFETSVRVGERIGTSASTP